MNPYLEQDDTWDDFHHGFICRARIALGRQLGAHHAAKLAVRWVLRDLPPDDLPFFARQRTETVRVAHVEIHDLRTRTVVTVVKLRSPAHGSSEADRGTDVRERLSALATPAHLVEIDLRRSNTRTAVNGLPVSDYRVMVSRYTDPRRVAEWPVGLRERLPPIPVPLTPPDPDVVLDLQEVVHKVYDAADYGKYIYGEEPSPPLTPADAEWAKQFVPPNGR
jgi:hypothetical protein